MSLKVTIFVNNRNFKRGGMARHPGSGSYIKKQAGDDPGLLCRISRLILGSKVQNYNWPNAELGQLVVSALPLVSIPVVEVIPVP